MAKSKKISKAAKQKLLKAIETLRAFSTDDQPEEAVGAVVGDKLLVRGNYATGATGAQITFSLVFNNPGVAAVTNAVLHSLDVPDVPKVTDGRDSQIDIPIGTDQELNGFFLNIKSKVVSTNVTPLPSGLKVDFTMNGGNAPRSYAIPPATFNKVGDAFIIDISIVIFQL